MSPGEHILEKEICKRNIRHSANCDHVHDRTGSCNSYVVFVHTCAHAHTHTRTHARFLVIKGDIQFKLIKLSLGEKPRYDRQEEPNAKGKDKNLPPNEFSDRPAEQGSSCLNNGRSVNVPQSPISLYTEGRVDTRSLSSHQGVSSGLHVCSSVSQAGSSHPVSSRDGFLSFRNS